MKKLTLLSTFIIFCSALQLYAQPKLSIQGVIKNSDGTAIEDGNREITFRLYEMEMGGTPVWEEVQEFVPVNGGIYSALLGAEEPLTPAFDVPYYLGVSIDGGNELQPRTLLTAAPTALSLIGQDNVFPNTGNVGIGTSSPDAQLDVDGDIQSTGSILATGTVAGGNMGVGGITNPEQALQISGNLLFKNINPQGGSASIQFVDTDNGTGPMSIAYIDDGTANLDINGGGVAINNGNLDVNGGAAIIRSNIGNSPGVVNATSLQWGREANLGKTSLGNHRGTGSGGFELIVYGPSGTFESRVLNINGGGDATLQGSLVQNSDRRLKKDIIPLTDVMEKITQLNGYNYKWKEDNRSKDLQLGMIAQEVQAVYPELVQEDEEGILSLDYIGLVPVLVEATKVQQSQIEMLQAQLDRYADQNEELSRYLWLFFWIAGGLGGIIALFITYKIIVGNRLAKPEQLAKEQIALA